MLAAYDAVADWAKARGHELAGPPRELDLSSAGAPERLGSPGRSGKEPPAGCPDRPAAVHTESG